jgi:hypothetical protein
MGPESLTDVLARWEKVPRWKLRALDDYDDARKPAQLRIEYAPIAAL